MGMVNKVRWRVGYPAAEYFFRKECRFRSKYLRTDNKIKKGIFRILQNVSTKIFRVFDNMAQNF